MSGKSDSTLTNYARCLSHMVLHFGRSPLELDREQMLDYLHFLKRRHKTPSDSFFKHTVYGLRYLYRVYGLPGHRVILPSIERPKKLPVVLCKRPFHGPPQVIEYLGRYTHKIAIGNHRIMGLDSGRVTFTAKDYRKGGARYGPTLSDAEFIRRFALHILPKGFVRIRHYGILSSAKKKTILPAIKAQVGDIALSAAREPIRHGICPVCKKGKLVTLMVFDSRGPPGHWLEKLEKQRSPFPTTAKMP